MAHTAHRTLCGTQYMRIAAVRFLSFCRPHLACCIRVLRSAFSICRRAFIFTLRPFGIYSFHKYFYKAFVSAAMAAAAEAARFA